MIASFAHQARCILAIGLLLGQVMRVASQGTVDASDLPSCAGSCASTAAIAAGCKLTDTACLCSHPAFSDATKTCAGSVCGVEDFSSVNGVLNNMCSATPSSSTSSSPPSSSGTVTSSTQASQSGSQGTRSSNSSGSPTGTATNNSSSGTSSPVGTIYTVSSQSQSSTSTAFIVQTVVLPQSTRFSGAVSRDAGFGFGFVGMGVVHGVMALAGGLLLLL